MPTALMTLRPLDEERCAWVLEIDGRLQSGAAECKDLPRPPEATRVRVLIPADRITHAAIPIAARDPKLIKQAIPYALEEQLAEDIEQMHFAHGPRDKEGRVQVRAIRREELERLLDRLRQQGLEPDGVFSELDCLPLPAEGWVTLAWNGMLLARGSQGEALALEQGLLGPLLDGAPVHAIDPPEGALIWLHRRLSERGMINLIGNGRARALGDRLRPWRIPAALAAAALILQAGLMAYETHNLKRQRAELQAEIERMAREAAPDIKRWVNPVAQLRQRAAGDTAPSAEGGMLTLLAQLAPALAAQSDIKLGNLNFQGGTLEAQLSATESASLEALVKTLRQKPGLAAELTEQRVEGGQATARLRLKEKRA